MQMECLYGLFLTSLKELPSLKGEENTFKTVRKQKKKIILQDLNRWLQHDLKKKMKFKFKADTNPINSNCKNIRLGDLNDHITQYHWYVKPTMIFS